MDSRRRRGTAPVELQGIASSDVRVPFEARGGDRRIVDGSEFEEFKPLYGTTLVTGWATLGGRPLGVLANNGTFFSEEAQKGAQFIQLCNRSNTPILFAQNITLTSWSAPGTNRAGIIQGTAPS